MAGSDDDGVGAAAERLSVRGRLWRAAMLARMGDGARTIADRLADACRFGDARSCFDAGAPLQLTVDAPGPAGLRAGVRLGPRFDARQVEQLVASPACEQLERRLAALPDGDHPSLGAWLFWTAVRTSVFVDLRDPDAGQARARLVRVLAPDEAARLHAWTPRLAGARPWALRLEADADGLRRVHVHWLLDRRASIVALAEAVAPGRWPLAARSLSTLIRDPARSGRFVVATPLDPHSSSALRLSTTGFALVPEDDAKQRALGRASAEHGGDRSFVEAMWSLARTDAPPRWRVGRACGVHVDDAVRLRWYLTPWVQPTA